MEEILNLVKEERGRQDAKFGANRNHSPGEWLMILGEEVGEVNKAALEAHFDYPISIKDGGRWVEDIPENRRRYHLNECKKELIQVAAVAVAIVESLERNEL